MKFVDSDLGRVVEFSGYGPEFTKHGLKLVGLDHSHERNQQTCSKCESRNYSRANRL